MKISILGAPAGALERPGPTLSPGPQAGSLRRASLHSAMLAPSRAPHFNFYYSIDLQSDSQLNFRHTIFQYQSHCQCQ